MNRKLSGFTLIELVIALAVIGILVTAAIAAFQNITQKAQITNLKATLKRVRSSILIQKAHNELDDSRNDTSCGAHPRINYWPTFEEVRRASYQGQLNGSILDSELPGNPLITNARNGSFDNTFVADCSGDVAYDNPDNQGTNLANNLVVAAPQGTSKGTLCPANPCEAGWVYNPYSGEFWANSNQFGEKNW